MQLRYQYAKFLKSFSWTWFVSMTFDKRITQYAASSRMNSYLSLLAGKSKDVSAFTVVETGRGDGRVHCHALIAGTARIPIQCRKALSSCTGCGKHLWKYGFAHIVRYDPSKGAAFYVAKQIGQPSAHWDFWGELQTEPDPLPLAA